MAKTAAIEVVAEPIKLDLGCGQSAREGYTGVDIRQLDGVKVLHDLERYPWPWSDESVECVYSSHYIEHVSDLIPFMEELSRILVPGGTAHLIAPYWANVRCWQDPTHKQAISESTFLYFNKGWREQNQLQHYDITCDFDFSYSWAMAPEWQARSDEARAFAIRHYVNVVNDIHVYLTKRPPTA
jgi:SAM-dependent methyltransferase